ncbi:MAG: beta-N-acetylhexosaminidase [Candidatus Marinimicrobia bacterium]|nr:beta-N-acetylhexosaminidase [Candidatus Neomarinimicrobiota bacterium]
MNKYIFLNILIVISFSCSNKNNQEAKKAMNYKLTWGMISNYLEGKSSGRAAFTIHNTTNQKLGNKGWAIFYSQSPRRVTNHSNSNANINQINGDWYSITPNESFSLPPGDQITIQYDMSHFIIKETDAPLYPYLVLYDQDGNEKDIRKITDYSILPFDKPEKINRGKNDVVPIPNPENRFLSNNNLSLLGEDEVHKIIPTPFKINSNDGSLLINDALQIYYSADLKSEAKYLRDKLQQLTGRKFSILQKDYKGGKAIVLITKPISINKVSSEAYVLEISSDSGLMITGSDPAGVFYGIQSFMALLPINVFQSPQSSIEVSNVYIEDAPRFPYRGQHLDVCRNFFSKKAVFKLLDIMSFYKLNHLQLYLSEDEGWRIEIKELPELTIVGGQRQHNSKEAAALHPSYGSGPNAYEENTFGSGFYSREDFIEILQYATERHIKVIPTINFPGHARAAIKAMEARYKYYMEKGEETLANEYRLIDPNEQSKYYSAQGYDDNVVNVARESVYKFYSTVIKSISDLYNEADVPFTFFHTGGDEVPQGSWSDSPMINDLLESMDKKIHPMDLQINFFRRAVKMLEDYNVKIGGWEEVVLKRMENRDGGGTEINPEFINNKVIPYFWINAWGQEDLAYRLANHGYEVVLCNVTDFYFDFAYDKDPKEPGLYWGGFNNTKDAFETAPLDLFKTTTTTTSGKPIDVDNTFKDRERLKEKNKKNIIGVQAQLWSETIKGDGMLEYFYLPKIIGFSETAWKERKWETIDDKKSREKEMLKSWNIFANTIARKDLPRLYSIFGGFNYRVPTPGAVIEDDLLKANTEFPGLEIRYTMDGADPTAKSTLYEKPVKVTKNVKLRSFDSAGNSSRISVVKYK